jgi:tetratricopeptide (TPR) repeat protein
MSDASKKLKLETAKILRMASEMQPVPEGGHFTDDEELLTCLSSGLLGPGERQQIIDHLAICPRCRKELTEMIRRGVIEFAEVDNEQINQESWLRTKTTASTPIQVLSRKKPRWQTANWIPLAVAASIVIALGGLWWLLSPPDSRTLLARAERDLEREKPVAAMDSLERLLAGRPDPQTEAKGRKIFEKAGYQAAKSELAKQDFKEVLAIEQRISSHAGSSARLRNLSVQAERRMPYELALNSQGSLLDYGYQPNGTFAQKGIPLLDTTTSKKIDEEFHDAVVKYPQDAGLLLNRGHFYLTLNRFDQARECFAEVLRQDQGNALARLGMGLLKFQQRRFEEALREFETLVAMQPDDLNAHLNAAMCLEQLGQREEARAHWQRALELSKDPSLRERIEAQISLRNF